MGAVKYFCLVIVVQITQPVLARYEFTDNSFSPDFSALYGKSVPISEAQDWDFFKSGILEPQTDPQYFYGQQINTQSFNDWDNLNKLSNYIEHNYEHVPVDLDSLNDWPTHNFGPANINIPPQTILGLENFEDNSAFADIIIDIEIDNTELPPDNNKPKIQRPSNWIHNKINSPIANINNNHYTNDNKVIHPRLENSIYDPHSIMHYSVYSGKMENGLYRYESSAQQKVSPYQSNTDELIPFDMQADNIFEDDEFNEPQTTYDVNDDFEISDYYHLLNDLHHQPRKLRNNIQSSSKLQSRPAKSIMHYSSYTLPNHEPALMQSRPLKSSDNAMDFNFVPEFETFDSSLLELDESFKDLDDYYNLFSNAFKSDRVLDFDRIENNDKSEKTSDQKSMCPLSLYRNTAYLPPEVIDVSAIVKNGQRNTYDKNQLLKVLLLSQLFSKDGNNLESLKSLLPFLCLS